MAFFIIFMWFIVNIMAHSCTQIQKDKDRWICQSKDFFEDYWPEKIPKISFPILLALYIAGIGYGIYLGYAYKMSLDWNSGGWWVVVGYGLFFLLVLFVKNFESIRDFKMKEALSKFSPSSRVNRRLQRAPNLNLSKRVKRINVSGSASNPNNYQYTAKGGGVRKRSGGLKRSGRR